MSKDHMVDVLNDLDEDLIFEAVKCRTVQRSYQKKWVIPTAVTACFCVVVSVFFYAGGFDLLAQNSENDLAVENSDVYYSLQDNITQETESAEENIQEVPSVIVKVDSWTVDGFTGVVTGLVDTDALPLGSRVAVKTDEATDIELSAFSASSDMEETKTETKFDASITVRVMFRSWGEEDFIRNENDDGRVYQIYAEQVSLAEDASQ